MTVLIALKTNRSSMQIWADTRLSTGASKLTDKMPKIFVLNVRCYVSSMRSELKRVLDASIGVGFVGSSSVAFATITVLQNYLMSMIVPPGASTPSLGDVAHFARELLAENFRDFGTIWPQNSNCGLLVFGALPSDKQVRAFYLNTQIKGGGETAIDVVECDFLASEYFAFGSGAERFHDLLAKRRSKQSVTSLPTVLMEQINEGRPDVGGGLQAADVRPGLVTLPQILVPRPERGAQEADLMFIGRTDLKFLTIGSCVVGSNDAFGP